MDLAMPGEDLSAKLKPIPRIGDKSSLGPLWKRGRGNFGEFMHTPIFFGSGQAGSGFK